MSNDILIKSPLPFTANMEIRQGSMYQVLDIWLDQYSDESIIPHDLTDWTAKMQFRTVETDAVVATFSSASARILLPVEGQSQVTEYESTGRFVFADSTKIWNIWTRLSAADTRVIPVGLYVYELDLIPPSGEDGTQTFRDGVVRVMKEVTR